MFLAHPHRAEQVTPIRTGGRVGESLGTRLGAALRHPHNAHYTFRLCPVWLHFIKQQRAPFGALASRQTSKSRMTPDFVYASKQPLSAQRRSQDLDG